MKSVILRATVMFFSVILAVVIGVHDLMAEESRGGVSERIGSRKSATADQSEETPDQQTEAATTAVSNTPSENVELRDVLEFAREAHARIDREIDDYTCVLYKRERVEGEVVGWQSMALKIRHEKKEGDTLKVPFSVYVRFLEPSKVAGRAVLYVSNRNNGDLIARRGGRRSPNMTFQLVPTSPLATLDNRYPITEIGFKNLAKRLIEVLDREIEHGGGELQVWKNARIGDRHCTHYRLTHHTPRPELTYHMAEVSVDDELGIPIRYGAYDFPREEGGKPRVLEQYVYTKVRTNVGLTDKDFNSRNPKYKFQLHHRTEDKLTKD